MQTAASFRIEINTGQDQKKIANRIDENAQPKKGRQTRLLASAFPCKPMKTLLPTPGLYKNRYSKRTHGEAAHLVQKFADTAENEK
jgi:hypothetical protein